jgi:hypothetical protein
MNNFIKLTIVAIFSVILAVPAEAKRVEPEKAKKLAQNFVESKRGHWAKADIRLKHTAKKRKQKREQEETALYYVFNVNEAQGGGFVIVAGDDAVKPVLGYSDSGNYDENNLPPNFAYWMDFLGEQIAYAQELGLGYSAPYDHGQDGWAAISPLIQTQWNQSAPYNNMTPIYNGQRSVTGCVATAMAQIMKYWNHPMQGTGSSQAYTTTTNGIPVPAVQFYNTTYDWQNMKYTYPSSTDNTPQNNAVATLMYHAGVSVSMDYTPESSAAYSNNVVNALKTNFEYDNNIQLLMRNTNEAIWENTLREQINADMPVFYSGQNSESGHAFILDGYDNMGNFHFNWGWGGRYDGYFVTTALNPGTGGAGAGSGTYNQNQAIIINIKPKYAAVRPTITLPPSNQTVQAGNTAQFTVAASATGPLTYQWQVSTNKISVKDTFFREDFEGSNSFTLVNDLQTNKWMVGTATVYGGTKSAYISNNNGTSNALTPTSPSIVHMYRDVTFPVFEACTLWYYRKGKADANNLLTTWIVETSLTPTAGNEPSGSYSRYTSNFDNWGRAYHVIPAANSGTTKRLVFTWKNDGSSGTNPPIAVDDIVIVATNSKPGETPFKDVSDGTGGTTATYTTSMATEAMNGYRYRSIVKNNNGLPIASISATLTVIGTIPKNYIINGSGTTFTATKSGLTVGTANQSISNVIAAIRTDAAGNDCTIQFGSGNSTLDIGSNNITFDVSGLQTWGLITLTGKITSSNTNTISLSNGSSIESTADIANTNASGRAIYNNSTGAVNIRGGTVSAATGVAVYNVSTGKITVSGTATKVTSANVTSTSGTIVIATNGTETAERLTIIGGTVENTAGNANARAIYNNSTGAVNISGGTVSATSSGRAIHNNSTGTVTISGGTVSVPAGYAVYSMDANSSVVLGGNPSIIGSIATASEKLSLAANFAPVSKTYTLAFASYTNGSIAVPKGKNYLSSFKLRQCYALKAEGENLVIGGYLGTCPKPTTTYIINGSGGAFTATKNGVVVGTAGQTIATVITAIQTDVAGYDCVIQFGDGTSTLDIGSGNISFSGNINLGVVTLAGKITSSNTNTISLSSGSSIESTADIANTNASGRAVYSNSTGFVSISGGEVSATTGYAVYNYSTGTVNISGGEVSATTGYAVYNASTGTVSISGGEVSATTGNAVRNNSTGAVSISGGEVSATTGNAVYNYSTGKITVSGIAKVTSANVINNQGTIYLRNDGTEIAERLSIIGGAVENTAGNANARTIYNASTGAVNISGGTISTPVGYAVYNNSTGAVNINGGTISAPASYAVYSMNASSSVILGGNPSINGSLATASEKLSLAANFAPVSKTYTLAFASYTNGSIAVPKGKNYLSNFKLRQCYALKAGDGDIVIGEYLGTCPKPTTTYIINGSGGAFTATKNGVVVGTADQSIATVITAIQTDVAGYDCVIQFGDGTSTLDIGSSNISFSGNINLGVVTLAGKITSANTSTSSGTISLSNGSSIESTADIANTSGRAVYNNSTGFVSISGGEVSATTGRAVQNNSTGAVNISGGEVSATTGSAVYNASTGAVNISGGEVKTTTGSTVFNNSTGKITVSGTAKVTSANVSSTNGTIVIATNGTETAERLAIVGGTVENTAATVNARAIYNASTGAVTISGGTVTATTSGRAVHNNSTGTVIVNGGTVIGGTKYFNNNSDGTIIAWDNSAGSKIYTEFESNDIIKFPPATVTAQWLKKDGIAGIDYANGTKTGFAAVAGVTVKVAGLENYAPPKFFISSATTEPHAYELHLLAFNKDDHGELSYSLGTFTDNGNILAAEPELNGKTLSYQGTGKTSGTATLEITVTSQYYTDITATITFEATSKTAVTIIGITAQNSVYDGTPQLGYTGIATALPYTGALIYEYAGAGHPQSTTPPTKVGEYTIIVTVPPDAPYTGEWRGKFNITAANPILPQIATGSIRVQPTTNAIVLENLPRNTKVQIYNIQGKQIYSANSENSIILRIPVQTKGMYIVKVGAQTIRTVVR